MASFTGVGDTTDVQMADKGEDVLVSLSGTYNMTIALQREVGSVGSGAWQELKRWTTANATVAYTHVTEQWNEHLRLIVLVDNSGTCTATIADNSVKVHGHMTFRDPVGNKLGEWTQRGLKVYGGIRPGGVTTIGAATTLTGLAHGGRLLAFGNAAGATVTLPAATGTGEIFRFFVVTTVTSNSDKIQVASANDIMAGQIHVAQDGGDTSIAFETAATSDTITLNGTTTGGIRGDYIELEDVANGLWRVHGWISATGTEATPFSAAV